MDATKFWSKEKKLKELFRLTVLENPFIPHYPTPKQALFLMLPHLEAIYGGAAGGGKSDALLMAALQYVMVPGYSAILFRRTFTDLALPGALMDRSFQWLDGKAKWIDKRKQWVFPSGATLTFGYLESERDKYRYASSEYQFIGFDELTEFKESQYRFLFSRLRRLKSSRVPVRMRAASNPGGDGHEWVKQRFIVSKKRPFIPARFTDNPYIDRDSYLKSLNELDPVTREQLLNGNWNVVREGAMFKREWFEIVSTYPANARFVRYWDLAATEKRDNNDPCWTVGLLLAMKNGIFWVVDVRRTRSTPLDVENLIRQTAILDGKRVSIRMEQEPGASGVNTIDHYARNVLLGYDFKGVRPTGSKVLRASPVSAAAEAGRIKLISGPWIPAFLDEAELFPGKYKDQIDALSGAFSELSSMPKIVRAPAAIGETESYWHCA